MNREEKIQNLAYHIWLRKGRPHNSATDDWAEAEEIMKKIDLEEDDEDEDDCSETGVTAHAINLSDKDED